MSEALILEFSGVDGAKYREVNTTLGIDPETGEGDWPDGLLTHIGASSANGLLVTGDRRAEFGDAAGERIACDAQCESGCGGGNACGTHHQGGAAGYGHVCPSQIRSRSAETPHSG